MAKVLSALHFAIFWVLSLRRASRPSRSKPPFRVQAGATAKSPADPVERSGLEEIERQYDEMVNTPQPCNTGRRTQRLSCAGLRVPM